MSSQADPGLVPILDGQTDALELLEPAPTVPESIRRLWGVPADHDLPPSWDGVSIEWWGWGTSDTSLEYHLPLDQLACTHCGGLGGARINWGSRHEPKEDRQIRSLWAARCQDCGHDQVHDILTKEHWDLDPDDYGDEGSTEHKEALF